MNEPFTTTRLGDKAVVEDGKTYDGTALDDVKSVQVIGYDVDGAKLGAVTFNLDGEEVGYTQNGEGQTATEFEPT